MNYPNLPGFQVVTTDGALRATTTPVAKSTVVIGTAGQGPADALYPVLDPALAAQLYGLGGTLIRSMEEVATRSDNVLLFRMGTAPATLSGVGGTTGGSANPGLTLTFNGDRSAAASTNYRLYYSAGVLYVWYNQTLVYANDPGVQVVDTGDISISGVVTAGEVIGTDKTWSGAVTLTAAAALTPPTGDSTIVLTAAVDGLGMTPRQTYVAQQKAMDLLMSSGSFAQVVVPNCTFDNLSVAFGATVDSAATGAVLDWLKTTQATDGHMVYQWASETKDSDGLTVTAAGSFTDPAARLTAGYHEVCFGYQLARFCATMSEIQPYNGVTEGFIGMSAPKSFSLANLRTWIGKSPTKDPITGVVSATGSGMLGNPYLAGCASATLHLACTDKATGRTAGLFENGTGEYDGGASYDSNGMPIDIGAFLHVFGDWGYLSTGYGSYSGNGSGLAAGLHASMSEKSSLLFKPAVAVQTLYTANLAQLDALTAVGVNMFTKDTTNGTNTVRFLHGKTVANPQSDFIFLTRQDIKGKVVKTAVQVARPFLGECSTDGLQMQAMQTALDAAFGQLKKDGFIGMYKYAVTATQAQQRLGQSTLQITFQPALEAVKITIQVGLAPYLS